MVKPIIFVMDDKKEDWWILDKKHNPIIPREELFDEISDKAKVKFWMYTTSQIYRENA
jgi:hypothetical protein